MIDSKQRAFGGCEKVRRDVIENGLGVIII